MDPKDIGRPFQDLELSYRPIDLRSLINEAYAQHQAFTRTNVEYPRPGGVVQRLEIEVQPLQENGNSFAGVSITFRDVTQTYQLHEELQRTKQEVETANEELQSTNEELETTNEELQSTVEELETTNEELQSTNEELETMNEELQSTNEELQTVNDELHTRTNDFHTTNAFLQSILTSLRTGVAVVDRKLHILTWNWRAQDLWGLRPEEVIGQSFLNLDIGLPGEQLRDPLRACLAREQEHLQVILTATNRRGRVIRCRTTCSTLKNAESEPQGVIILMEELEP